MLTRDAIAPVLEKVTEANRQIEEIDAQLGQEASGKTRVLNQAADRGAEKFGAIADQLKAAVDEQFGEDRVFLLALVRRVLRNHQDEIDVYIKENVVTQAQTVDSDTEKRLREERKQLVGQIQSVRSMLEAMGATDILAEVPDVKNLRGGGTSGPRGKRLRGSFSFRVNGVAIAGKTLTDVKDALNAESVKDVRTSIEAANAGFDWESPPSSFSFTHGGVEVVATSNDSDLGDDDTDVDSADESMFEDDDDR